MPTARTKREAPAAQATETLDYPAWWDWDSDEDGNTVAGTFVGMGKGFTVHGERVFVTLEVNGAQRTIWLHWAALLNQFAREVHRRPDKRIHAGERVTVHRLDKRTSGNGYDYFDFKSEFPDGPEVSQADMLTIPGEPTAADPAKAEAPTDAGGSPDDDIPF
jgi:hypothetical protein